MPHVSKQKVDAKTKQELDTQLVSLLADTSAATRKRVFQELLTETEKIMLAKRLAAIYLIGNNVSTHKIADTLRMSPSTVARFEHAVSASVYSRTTRWLRTVRIGKPIMQLLEKIAAIPFDAQKKSLAQLSKDW